MKRKTKMAKTAAVVSVILMMALIMLNGAAPANAQPAAEQPQAGPLPTGATPSITIEGIPYLSFTPNPIGVGQLLLVNIWLQPPIT
jgi:hypothetical protein